MSLKKATESLFKQQTSTNYDIAYRGKTFPNPTL